MDENVNEANAENTTQPDAVVPAKVEKKTKGTAIVKQDVQFNANSMTDINLFNPDQLAAAKNFLTEVMRSDKGGIKSVNEGLAVLMRAKDLNLPFSTCIEHIHVINGKTGIDIHIIKALLSRAGCTWNLVKDYQPLYEYTDGINVYMDGSFPDYVERCVSLDEATKKTKADTTGDKVYIYPVKWYKDFNGNLYKDYQLNTNQFGICVNRAQATEINNAKKIPVFRIPNQASDYVTEYVINRTLNGKEISATGKFSYQEAMAAGMFDKDTYKKYPKVLIGHRAFTYAAREIASDILFGVMETTELKIVTDRNISDDELTDVQEAEVINI